jgi:hypothetical protein
MKKIVSIMLISFLVIGFSAVAYADLDVFLRDLNVQAKADMGGFSARVSAQFGVPVPRVHAIIKSVDNPADAFMCFEIGRMTGRAPDAVVTTYRRHKGKGWGVIAKEMGIKPGSAEFHALKRGDLTLTGKPGGPGGKGPGKKEKVKGKGKWKDRDDSRDFDDDDRGPGKGRGQGRGQNR